MNIDLITLDMLITANNRYPDRLQSPELTDELKANGMKLLEKVNQLLRDLNITTIDLSSGFRPSTVNEDVPNAAKNSAHELCMAVDLIDDKNQSLAKLLENDYNINKDNSHLVKNELYMESPLSTIGHVSTWIHLQIRPTINRVFIP